MATTTALVPKPAAEEESSLLQLPLPTEEAKLDQGGARSTRNGLKTPGHIVVQDHYGPRIDNRHHTQLPYTGEDLRRAAAWVVAVGFVFMVIVVILEANNNFDGERVDSEAPGGKITGSIAVAGALFLFGSVGLMFKEPPDEDGVLDPVIFQAFNALGIFLVGVPIILFEEWMRDQSTGTSGYRHNFMWFDWLGFVGAVDIIIVSFWASLATQLVGYAMAPAILNGVGMVISFAWGKLFFHEAVQNYYGAAASLSLLVIGVGLLAATHVASEREGMKKARFRVRRDSKRPALGRRTGIGRSTAAAAGFLSGLMAGVFDGALMVPYKLHVDQVSPEEGASLRHTLAYLASFSLGSLITAPALIVFAAAREYVKVEAVENGLRHWLDRFQRKTYKAMLPGGITGVVWAMGNFLSVHATKHLGMSIGFPLVQTGILVAAVWGIFFFKDINVKRVPVAVPFSLSLMSLLGGAALLAQYG